MTEHPQWTQETEDRLVRAVFEDQAERWGYAKNLSKETVLKWVERQEHGPNVKADVRAILQALASMGLLLPPGRTEPQLLGMETKLGATTVTIEAARDWMQEIAGYLVELLEADAGLNYAEWDIKPAGQSKPYRMILVRPGGKSPHELRLEAEQELQRLRVERLIEADQDWPEGY